MARSILPSTTRTPGAFITAAKRRNRRGIARQLHVANGVPDDWDDEFDAVDLTAYPDVEIRQQVRWRRGADKLHHFERWAVRSTRDLPPEQRLSTLRARLPRGLIGDHAFSHLERLPELRLPCVHERWPLGSLRAARAARMVREARALTWRRAVLRDVLAHGAHGDLNRAMKAAAYGNPPRWRTLAGAHDLDAFLVDVATCERWQVALDHALDGHVVAAR